MTPSEKEKIIEEGFDAIRKVYNLRDDLLSDSEKLEDVKESNRKLSDRVANLEVTIKALNSAIDKKDAEIERLREELDLLQKAHAKLCGDYYKLNKALTEELESDFHELRQKLTDMYMTGTLRGFSTSDFTEFAKWFNDTFGDFGKYDEEE